MEVDKVCRRLLLCAGERTGLEAGVRHRRMRAWEDVCMIWMRGLWSESTHGRDDMCRVRADLVAKGVGLRPVS